MFNRRIGRITLEQWTQHMQLPRMSSYGMTADDIPRIVANCHGNSMKTNPVLLSDAEVGAMLEARL